MQVKKISENCKVTRRKGNLRSFLQMKSGSLKWQSAEWGMKYTWWKCGGWQAHRHASCYCFSGNVTYFARLFASTACGRGHGRWTPGMSKGFEMAAGVKEVNFCSAPRFHTFLTSFSNNTTAASKSLTYWPAGMDTKAPSPFLQLRHYWLRIY